MIRILSTNFLRSSKINKFYVHDDQIGPFARIEYCDDFIPAEVKNNIEDVKSFNTSWTDDDLKITKVNGVPHCTFTIVP